LGFVLPKQKVITNSNCGRRWIDSRKVLIFAMLAQGCMKLDVLGDMLGEIFEILQWAL
jgi:hypothetical protein